MKTRFRGWLGLGLMLCAAPDVSSAAFGDSKLVNGSFESWNLVGWDFYSDVGTRAEEPFTRTAGAARTKSTWGETLGINQTSQHGFRFLLLNTRPAANFLGNEDYDFFVSQSFTLNAGEAVFGWASFLDRDTAQLDSAWVRILDQDQNVIATPWVGLPANGAAAITPTSLPWTLWQWEAATGGNYTLQLGMSTSGANNESSFALFDGVGVGNPSVIPEPTSMVLGIVGGIALLVLRNRNR
jgi:hypothetical protein